MIVRGTTQLLGVIGYPVKHSFSPLMHNAAIAHLQKNTTEQNANLDFVYLPFPIHSDKLSDAISGFSAIGVKGFNITIPHKQAIIPLLDEVTDVAQAIGAVNTVWRSEEGGQTRWHGTNTDAAGFIAPLKTLDKDWSNVPALILGNGGAARAIVAACVELGCSEVWVCGRSRQKLSDFADSWKKSSISKRLSVLETKELDKRLPQAGLVVNATPVGMHPNVKASPLSLEQIQQIGQSLPKAAPKVAYDLIYTPRPTQFLQYAQDVGLVAIDGLEMLVQQGAMALEIWIGQPAPVNVMRKSLLDYLGEN